MTSQEMIEKYIKFYVDKGHKQIPNVSLVPEGDSTLLFVNSGMFPLVPYLSGEPHPLGKRLVNIQRSLRFEDIEEVGDSRHTIAFHMIGNWSLGDYFKKDQLPWLYEFLVEVLGIPAEKLYATVFEGDANAPKDVESIEIIKDVFKKYGIDAKEGERIFACPKSKNWWQRGDAVGELGGPDSEVYYYMGKDDGIGKDPSKNEDEFLEIGNSVFMQYKRAETGWENLPQKNVDFGGGMERLALAVQGKDDIFETDTFWPIISRLVEITGLDYKYSLDTTKSMRILADHMRAATLLTMDDVIPSNKDQGYILRRIIRRMVRVARKLGIEAGVSVSLTGAVLDSLSWLYPNLNEKRSHIKEVFSLEEDKFRKTLEKGSKEVERVLARTNLDDAKELAQTAFYVYQSLGYPLEIFLEDLKDKNISVNSAQVEELFNEIQQGHQSKSRAGAEQKFKGGLADQSEDVIKYHTLTHLLQQALRNVLGDHVRQLGSNITGERLRFDFPNRAKLLDEEVARVESIVNETVSKNLPVQFVILPQVDAKAKGALYIPTETYPDEVKVYFVGKDLDSAFSREFCGGPHVSNTAELRPIKIYKQENIGEGKIRVYAKFSD